MTQITIRRSPFPFPLFTLFLLLFWFFPFFPAFSQNNQLNLPDIGEYEIYSTADIPPGKKILLKETPRNAINEDGLIGFFSAETADRLASGRMFVGSRYDFKNLTSRRGIAYFPNEEGFVHTYILSAIYLGRWAEWAISVPMHSYSLSAPRTYGTLSQSNTGLGDLKISWKATYLPDRSYYRFAYGFVAFAATGNPNAMKPAGPKNQDELKLFGCVTTKETDYAVANLNLGAIVNSEGRENRFIYKLGLSYEASRHASLIGEFAGEVQGDKDHDSLDMITGIRLSPTPYSVLEMSYTKNLRTYREYGWDDRWEFGTTIRW